MSAGFREGCTCVNESSCGDAEEFEDEYVHKVYDKIASHFSHTRYKQWPKVRKFLDSLPIGSIVLDVGCGNGKYLRGATHITVIGCDRSVNLLRQCRPRVLQGEINSQFGMLQINELECSGSVDRVELDVTSATPQLDVIDVTSATLQLDVTSATPQLDITSATPQLQTRLTSPAPEVYRCDARRLSIKDGSVDACICIAVIHHLSTPAKRVAALREVIRCVRHGGDILLYVWAFEQKSGSIGSRRFDSQDVLVPWHYQSPCIKMSKQTATMNSGKIGEAKNRSSGQSSAATLSPIVSSSSVGGEKTATYQRYYHIFRKEEVQSLSNELSDLVAVQKFYFDSNNWAVHFVKRHL